jgi:outer membrane protein OmpA-like peptidoglycan-associated protein/outer membrane protein W
MTLRSALLAATMVALPLAANAEGIEGFYIGAGVGANLMQNEKLGVTGVTGTGNLQTNVGVAGVGSVGWGFGNGFRAELEGSYRYNSLNKITGAGGSASVTGSEQKYGPMVNVLYDFTTVSPSVIPYVGVGAGYQFVRESVSAGGGSVNATKGGFAYQAILGVAVPVDAVPGLAVTGEYRFLGVAGTRNYSGINLSEDYNHSLMLGVRYAFGAVAAPMAPAAAPAPAAATSRSYLVFFDWDKANLTERARGIIKDAAVNSTKVAYTKIDVNGNADTSGTKAYNQGLSMRRAQAVAAELVKDGVPKAAIAITASGDTHLLVPTGPGVREPQNRRVEINIR